MQDEQSRLGESMLSLPTGPVKEQLENLITQLNFEAHKAEAVMVDNKE